MAMNTKKNYGAEWKECALYKSKVKETLNLS